jgi:hypothetical protein
MQTTTARKCSRCGTEIETCAFCDQPDCPAITCYRCVSVACLDRLRSKSATSSPTQR